MSFVKMLAPLFDKELNKKIKDFCLANDVSPSEVLRVLVKRSKIKIDARSRYTLQIEARRGKLLKIVNRFCVSQETLDKVNKMCIKNNVSCSEIIRKLINDADLQNIKFRKMTDRLIREDGTIDIYLNKRTLAGIRLDILLDYNTKKKLKDFSIKHDVPTSEILRVLLEESNIKIDVKDKKTITNEAAHGHTHDIACPFYLPEELIDKIRKMRIENHTSYSEIVRNLIEKNDLKKMKFRPTNEIISTVLNVEQENEASNYKMSSGQTYVNLPTETHKKLQDFITKNKNTFFISEIIRVLIDTAEIQLFDKPITATTVRDKSEYMTRHLCSFVLKKDTKYKLYQIRNKLNINYSDIITRIIDNADFEKMTFRKKKGIIAKEQKAKNKNMIKIKNLITIKKIYPESVFPLLDPNTYKKIKDFAIKNNISRSEIIRVLIRESDTNIDARDTHTIYKNFSKKNIPLIENEFNLSKEELKKLDDMQAKYNSSRSEVIRKLIEKADLDSMHFKTFKEIISEHEVQTL
jgi:metal-responsive CopG/Arc/MetJ family transcriptional regulator